MPLQGIEAVPVAYSSAIWLSAVACASPQTMAALDDPSWGPVIAAGQFVPCRPVASGGTLPRSVVSGEAISGAVVQLDENGLQYASLSEAIMLSRVMRYNPLGSGKVLVVP